MADVQQFTIPAGARDKLIKLNNFTIDGQGAALHHIIPFSTLRNFWNFAIQHPSQSVTKQYLSGLLIHLIEDGNSFYSTYLNNKSADAKALAEKIRTEGFSKQLSDEEKAQLKLLQSLYLWTPGNLFVGIAPGARYDEAIENFEYDADVFLTDDKYKILHEIFEKMQKMLKESPDKVKDIPDEDFIAIFDLLMAIPTELHVTGKWFELKYAMNFEGRFSISDSTEISVKVLRTSEEVEHTFGTQ